MWTFILQFSSFYIFSSLFFQFLSEKIRKLCSIPFPFSSSLYSVSFSFHFLPFSLHRLILLHPLILLLRQFIFLSFNFILSFIFPIVVQYIFFHVLHLPVILHFFFKSPFPHSKRIQIHFLAIELKTCNRFTYYQTNYVWDSTSSTSNLSQTRLN